MHMSYIIQRFLNFYYIFLLGWVVHVPQFMCGGQRIFLEVVSLLPGIEHKFSCLMTSAFNHWAIFLAPNQKENNGFLHLGSKDSFAPWVHTGLWKSRPEGQEFPHREELCVAAYSRRCLWLWNHGSFSGHMTFSSWALRESLWRQPLWGGGFDVGSSWWDGSTLCIKIKKWLTGVENCQPVPSLNGARGSGEGQRGDMGWKG